MNEYNDNFVLFDSIKKLRINGVYTGSIISKCNDKSKSVIFSDNISINDEEIKVNKGLKVGFENEFNKKVAFSKKTDFSWVSDNIPLEYSIRISDDIMTQYDEGQFSDAFPFTINMLHTAGLYLSNHPYSINHLDFEGIYFY